MKDLPKNVTCEYPNCENVTSEDNQCNDCGAVVCTPHTEHDCVDLL